MQSNPDIDTAKAHALKVLTSFLTKLQNSNEPFDIEAQVYAIMRAAESTYQRMHVMNGGGKPESVELPKHVPEFGTQVEYDARASRKCVCGQDKELNTLVCWNCFKRIPNSLKYFEGTYEQWLEQREVKS